MDSSSLDEKLFLFQIFLYEKMKKIKSNKKVWYHEICLKWKRYSEFHTLFKDFLENKKHFFQYFRIIPEKLIELNKNFINKLKNSQHSMGK